eukprot:2405123-Pleurochrysis_carterae.AAC.1
MTGHARRDAQTRSEDVQGGYVSRHPNKGLARARYEYRINDLTEAAQIQEIIWYLALFSAFCAFCSCDEHPPVSVRAYVQPPVLRCVRVRVHSRTCALRVRAHERVPGVNERE